MAITSTNYRNTLSKALVRYIRDERNYHNISLSRDDVAEALGVTKGMLTSIVHTELQTTFTDLVNQYRARHAVKLLKSEKNANATLDEIAIRSGFSNRMTMHRAFLKFYAVPPGKMREAYSS